MGINSIRGCWEDIFLDETTKCVGADADGNPCLKCRKCERKFAQLTLVLVAASGCSDVTILPHWGTIFKHPQFKFLSRTSKIVTDSGNHAECIMPRMTSIPSVENGAKWSSAVGASIWRACVRGRVFAAHLRSHNQRHENTHFLTVFAVCTVLAACSHHRSLSHNPQYRWK